jgi:hypothetical protein
MAHSKILVFRAKTARVWTLGAWIESCAIVELTASDRFVVATSAAAGIIIARLNALLINILLTSIIVRN